MDEAKIDQHLAISALLTFQFNKAAIQRLVTAANDAVMAEFREAA